MMDILTIWVFGQFENILPSVVIISGCGTIRKSFILDSSDLEFWNQFIPSSLAYICNVVHGSITNREHNDHHLLYSQREARLALRAESPRLAA